MKKNILKKIIFTTYLLFFLFGFLAPVHVSLADIVCNPPLVPSADSNSCVNPPSSYHLLAPITTSDNKGTGADIDTGSGLGKYLNLMINIFIGLCAVLAVIMIVIGGIEYMTSELLSSKEHGRERLTNAVLGLLVALGAYALLYTINPDLLNADLKNLDQATLVIAEKQLQSYSGQGKCEPIPSGVCSPAALSAAGFQNGTQASSICNGESTGDASLPSGVDKCSDGNSFSFGLFQINAIAHKDEIPGGVCSGVFQVNGTGTQGSCMPGQTRNINGRSICMQHDCKVTDQTKFQSCVNYLTNPTNNIAFAKNLRAARDWNQWGANASCGFH